MRFLLIPIDDRRQIEGEDVGMTVFDRGAERSLKRDWVVKEEAVGVGATEPAE